MVLSCDGLGLVSTGGDEEGTYEDDYEAEKSPIKGAGSQTMEEPRMKNSTENTFLKTVLKKNGTKTALSASLPEGPTLTICVLNATLVSSDGAGGAAAAGGGSSSCPHLQQLSHLHVTVEAKYWKYEGQGGSPETTRTLIPQATTRPSVTPPTGKFPVQFARGVNEKGDFEMDEPENIGQWDEVVVAQANSCRWPVSLDMLQEWKSDLKGADSVPENAVDIKLKVRGELVGQGRVRVKPMYKPYLKPGGIHTQCVYLSTNTSADALLVPKPPAADICARLVLGFLLHEQTTSKKSGIYASALPPDAGASKVFEMLLADRRIRNVSSSSSSASKTLPKSKLKERIKMLTTVDQSGSKKNKMTFATDDEAANVRFKPTKSEAAKISSKMCGYDFMNNPGTEGDFLDRTRAKAAASENAMRTRRGEEAYNDILEKKICNGCGNPQSYDEMLNKKVCTAVAAVSYPFCSRDVHLQS